jgi:hypothetical protein
MVLGKLNPSEIFRVWNQCRVRQTKKAEEDATFCFI